MRYDISKASAPTMPNLGKGTECIKILLSQVSKDVRGTPRSDAFPHPGGTFACRKKSA